ncbi:MAG: hypothetical protein A2W90_18385 [Bacteroidetes bacterium GWF2_42_66]|nr:MAG: hypothetical protein A2W92_11530 [Bacteroidetes bacterium GWA2_42_15]OFX98221.1 MAG: hypothetical protein A2W89_09885 [Bacteroidetes bacterium GWE2_42_39]OFY42604.1 MAG: hypothetical protein A2W90_18385 [Bacteroidetes bacterium GWF2_42_66]HAZ03026.1 hypothetical protein [Marinilabiliales bacterium]HBL74324.1 hypothetical protein [Prolixibacteraceae bacterium]
MIDLALFDEILYRNLAPWLEENKPDEKFTALTTEIESVKPEFQPLHEIDFYRPFNDKTRFYQKLIVNESITYCNKVYRLIKENKNIKLHKYWKNNLLDKKLPTRLKDIGRIIREKSYWIDYINPRKTSFDIDADHKTETYILQLLKIALIRVYLEIQSFFSFISKDDILIEDDFYTRFLNEPIPETSFLKEAPKIIDLKTEEVKPRGNTPPAFSLVLDDIRERKSGVPLYHYIIKNPQRFASFEEKLFDNEYIGMDYSMKNTHGQKNKMAIIYYLLIDKGYFKKFNDLEKKPFKNRDIAKFLDHRYNANLDKQFRTYASKTQERAIFIEDHYWLYTLPPC